jgi:hypothetical protein
MVRGLWDLVVGRRMRDESIQRVLRDWGDRRRRSGRPGRVCNKDGAHKSSTDAESHDAAMAREECAQLASSRHAGDRIIFVDPRRRAAVRDAHRGFRQRLRTDVPPTAGDP